MEWIVSAPDSGGYENVVLKGDCDLYAAPAFAKSMQSRIVGGSKRLRLDLAGVEYLDSTGVGALIRILQDAKKSGCEVRFRGIEGSPRKVLKMSNILAIMKEDDAK
jgi:Anti-anti-sigma regulatory factor (antagonist of anti-sigma factor)